LKIGFPQSTSTIYHPITADLGNLTKPVASGYEPHKIRGQQTATTTATNGNNGDNGNNGSNDSIHHNNKNQEKKRSE